LLTNFYIFTKKVKGDFLADFAHKSFGEFLFAKSIKDLFSEWAFSTDIPTSHIFSRLHRIDWTGLFELRDSKVFCDSYWGR